MAAALIIVVGTLAFVTLPIKENQIYARGLVYAELAGLFGGTLALVLMAKVSSRALPTPVAQPTFLIALVFGLSLIGSSLIIYTVAGWLTLLRQPNEA